MKIVFIFIYNNIDGVIYMTTNEINKNEIILKVDFSSFEAVEKFIDLLKNNNVEVKMIGRDECLIQI